MKKANIMLKTIEDIKNFVNIVSKYDSDIDLASGKYVVDAKSIMGIFSLDLVKPIELTVCNDSEADAILKELSPFII